MRPPPPAEQEAFCNRLDQITAAGGQLSLVQIYTIARQPVESYVEPLGDKEVDELVELVKRRSGLNVAGFYGTSS